MRSSLRSFAASNSSGVGSRKTKTSRRLSGAQTKLSTSCGVSVRRWASPPRRLSNHTCVLPSLRSERNASDLPSGLQRGWEEEAPSEVMGAGSPPEEGTDQIRSSLLSSRKEWDLTV